MENTILLKRLLLAAFAVSMFLSKTISQEIQIVTSNKNTSLRGLSVVDNKIIWVSGSKGMVGRSIDGGKTWQWMTVKNFEARDFRDIEAFDKNTAVIMAISEPAVILKTTDGGYNWKIVFADSTKGMFLDAMNFNFPNEKMGIVVGDPVNDTIYIATTNDEGNSWKPFTFKRIKAEEEEGFFAASGTNIVYNNDGSFIAVSGGKSSRLLTPNETRRLNLVQGKTSTGANSIAVKGENAAIVGGDFSDDKDTTGNCIISNDDLQTWHKPVSAPHGYRSCVTFITNRSLICCGTSGTDISGDGGMHWKLISAESFHVCAKAKKGNAVFLAGTGGKIARLIWKK
ncbi:MAG: YCF48-related protein [Bacteroidota bacterium]